MSFINIFEAQNKEKRQFELFKKKKVDGLILDFFAGFGTTGQAVV